MKTEAEAQDNSSPTKKNHRLSKRLHRNLGLINHMTELEKDLTTTDRCIKALKKQMTQRSIEDISVLNYHLLKSDLNSKFKLDKISKENFNQLIVIMATYANYDYIPQEKYLFRIGDKATHLFIVIQGSAQIFTSNAVVKHLSANEYYAKLIQMKNTEDKELLRSTVKENSSIYPIEMSDMEILDIIILKMVFNDVPDKTAKEDLEKVFPNIKIDPASIGVDFENQGIFKINDIINDKIKNIPNEKILQYRFILNNNRKNYVKIFTYELREEYNVGGVFGEQIYNKYIHTALVGKETYLCKIDFLIYGDQLSIEKDKSKTKDIFFLLNGFFMTSIISKRFEREYFKYFIRSTHKKGEVIFHENEEINYLYFIQTGELELSSYRTILEMHTLINDLIDVCIDSPDDTCFDFDFKHSVNELVTYSDKKIKTKLFIGINQELLGVESWFTMPFLFTATVKSDVVELFKLPLCHLNEILDEQGVKGDLIALVKSKLLLIAKRLNNINSTSLGIIDQHNEIKEEQKVVHYKQKLLKVQQTLLNTNKVQEYMKSVNNIFLNQQHTDNHEAQLQIQKEKRKEIKMGLQKKLSLNPSIESLMGKKPKKFHLPAIQSTNISNSSFENRLLIKIRRELKSMNGSVHSISLTKRLGNEDSTINYTKQEVSPFITEVTQNEKEKESNKQDSERKTHRKTQRNKKPTLEGKTTSSKEPSSITVSKRKRVYQTPMTIEKKKKYDIFNQYKYNNSLSKPQEFYTIDTSSSSLSPSSHMNYLFQKNKLVNQMIERRRLEHINYKKKMMNKINLTNSSYGL